MSYPKIFAIGHPAVAGLFDGPVVVEEKVDGSQISFSRCGEELSLRSRSADIYPDAPGKLFAAAVKSVMEIFPLLHDGWTYRAEYLSKPHHNCLTYSRVPSRNMIVFDISTGVETYLPRRWEKEEECERLGLEVVPLFFDGELPPASEAGLREYLQHESILGGTKIEGVVVKNYTKFGRDGHCLMGKLVSDAYKEKQPGEWKKANPRQNDIVAKLTQGLRTTRRWEKAIERRRDAGKLMNLPKDIGGLIVDIQGDITAEEREYIESELYNWAMPHISRGVTAGFAEWYKQRLANLEAVEDGKTADWHEFYSRQG
jgi:hypothetical protein